MALIEDPEFRPWVEKYAADQKLFFNDFAMAFGKLIGKYSPHFSPLHPSTLPNVHKLITIRARSRER